MGLQHAYATANLLASLSPAYTWDGGAITSPSYLSDGIMSQQATFHSGTAAYDGSTFNLKLTIDLGSAHNVQAIALLNHNTYTLGAGFTGIRVRSSPDNVTWTTRWGNANTGTAPNTVTPRDKEHIFQLGSALSFRYWQIRWDFTSGVVFAPAIGELYFVSAQTTPARYMVFGYEETPVYKGTQFESYSGELRGSLFAGPLRRVKIQWSDLAVAERDDFLALVDAAKGGYGPNVLWSKQFDSTGTNYATVDYQDVILGKLRLGGGGLKWSEFDFNRFNTQGVELWSLGRHIGA